ncbi:C40 family peptidase [Candidatus Parcubacteria bacterium]|nr:C40 family peptidase [Candidatus Parcubacteria bacterium]
MILTEILSQEIVTAARSYLGKPFDWDTFNCVHFIRMVYRDVGIVFPVLKRYDYPPAEFHLSAEAFSKMPIGHSVFFKRKAKSTARFWSHVAIIIGEDTLIHNTRHLGQGVSITEVSSLLYVYDLAEQAT